MRTFALDGGGGTVGKPPGIGGGGKSNLGNEPGGGIGGPRC